MNLEQSLLKIIRGEKKAPLIMACLAVLSGIYRLAIAARNTAYNWRWIKSTQLPVPVISVGNIAVGGTGKTPFVHLLASQIQDKVKLAILTRGYRSQIERSKKSQQISLGKGPLCSPKECGDEPFFLAQKTKACIWVGVNRVTSGHLAIEQGANCLLLDDGMQHRLLKRDFEIVIVDAIDPISNGRFLPWGLLRDSPKRLCSADLIVATHIQGQEHYQQIQRQLASFTKAPIIAAQIEVINKSALLSRKVGVFCGIGNPQRFLQTVRDLNQEIVDTLILKDHESLQKDQLQNFAKKCREKGAEALLCTEKDYVKLPFKFSTCLQIDPVEVRLQIIAGNKYWENLIKNILDRVVK